VPGVVATLPQVAHQRNQVAARRSSEVEHLVGEPAFGAGAQAERDQRAAA
jgi:hypothetical protein